MATTWINPEMSSTFAVSYDARGHNVGTMFSIEVLTATEPEDIITGHVEFVASNNTILAERWGKDELGYKVFKASAYQVFVAKVSGPDNADRLLEKLSGKVNMLFYHKGEAVGGARVEGTAAAVAKLRECSMSAAVSELTRTPSAPIVGDDQR